MASAGTSRRSAEFEVSVPSSNQNSAKSQRGRDSSRQNSQRRRADSSRSDTSSASHASKREHGKKSFATKHRKAGRSEWEWSGQLPGEDDLARWKLLRDTHETMHALEDAENSVRQVFDFLRQLDGKGTILDMHGMRIALEHIFVKPACFMASSVCFEAAEYAADMMKRHKCRFPVFVVTEIAKAISLRANFGAQVAPFVRSLVRKALRHLPENERAFLARHIVFALAERHADFREFCNRSDSRSERGLQMDWGESNSQKFCLYNRSESGESESEKKWYEAGNDNDFVQKDSLCLLSLDLEDAERIGFGHQYIRHKDGAIVQVKSAGEKKDKENAAEKKENGLLVAKLRTPVTIPFEKGRRYRLDDTGVDEKAVSRIMEALAVLGRDSNEIEKQKAAPHPYLLNVLMVPPEEPLVANIHLQRKAVRSFLEAELEYFEYSDEEPIRVKNVSSGALLAWNQDHPNKVIRVGDRIAKVNGADSKEAILEELEDAHNWAHKDLEITFMRSVKIEDYGIQDEALQRISEQHQDITETTDSILCREEDKLLKRFNQSQMDALRAATTRRLALIQGPPGTGKTTTAVEIVCFLLEHKIVPTPILVSGHTNTSVDNPCVELARKGKRVVRLGGERSMSKIREECKAYVVNGEKACELEEAEVIFATCSGSGSGKLQEKGIYCHTVLIDEGSQATESSCLMPLCHGAQHLIIVGDQCQLEPMVKSDYAKREQLGTSLFNRLYKQGIVPTMLTRQFRMHAFICEFPSQSFYNGKLDTGVSYSERPAPKFWKWPSPRTPVCFVDVSDGVEINSGDKICNEAEALWVEKAVTELLRDPEMKQLGEDGTYPIAVVTGYAAQKKLIKEKFFRLGLNDKEDKEKCLIEVDTVDAFQGREKSVIIFSAVRANHETVGFLRDWRRINVMLTRARNGLIIFGHRDTLQCDRTWRHWLLWASVNGCIADASGQFQDAKGKYKPKCLLPEEWTLKINDLPSQTVAARFKVETREMPNMPACDSWEDYSSSAALLGEPTFTCTSTYTYESWEDFETPGESPVEMDSVDGSEPVFYSQSEFSESDVASSSEDGYEDAAGDYGPLERIMQEHRESSHTFQASKGIAKKAPIDNVDILVDEEVAEHEDKISPKEDVQADGLLQEFCVTLGTRWDSEVTMPAEEDSPYQEDYEDDVPQPSPLERFTTGNSIDGNVSSHVLALSHLVGEGGEAVQWSDEFTFGRYEMNGEMYVPVLLPVYGPPLQTFSLNSYACQVSSTQPIDTFSNQAMGLSQRIVYNYALGVSSLQAEWYADAKKFFKNDRSIVSAPIDVPAGNNGNVGKSIAFKMILSALGNGFAKSQGIGHFMLRCEEPLQDPTEAIFSFSVTIGERTLGPISHDFYAHPIAKFPSEEKPCKFRQAVNTTSNKLLVRLEVWPDRETPGKDLTGGCIMIDNPMQACTIAQDPSIAPVDPQVKRGMGRRARSDAGQLRQFERWQRRKAERAIRASGA